MDTTSPTPEPVPQDLWSSILDSVSSSHSIPSKQIVLLGHPLAGKSTIAAALLQKPAPEHEESSDSALGYDFADVRDEADEETLARLSVYTVPSSNTPYTSILPHFLPPRLALPDTLFMIVLDWTRPWTFVDELLTWLQCIDTWMASDNSRKAQIAREESKERLQLLWQNYTDPISAISASYSTVFPLGAGTLTHNSAGMPIIVICNKADLSGHDLVGGPAGMGGIVKGKKDREWEERTDSVMQILRTICLKYGAALFSTTQMPATQQILRQYALHLLFSPSPPSPGMASVDNPFPFRHLPNTFDRDRIVIPAGWDSWGKIAVVREFDPKSWGEAWQRDLDNEEEDAMGARNMFAAVVPNQGSQPPSLPPFNNPTPEQAFLSKNFDENSRKPHRDPLGISRNAGNLQGAAAGIVSPLGSSSFNLPNVERALSDMVGIGSTRNVSDPRRPLNATVPNTGSPPVSPTPAVSSPSPTNDQTRREVLQNFFDNLRDRRGASSVAGRTDSEATNGATANEDRSS